MIAGLDSLKTNTDTTTNSTKTDQATTMTPPAEEATTTTASTTTTAAVNNTSNNNNNNNNSTNHNSSNSISSVPEDIVTPSHVAKSKWNDVIDNLPSEDLSLVTRTYVNRLHQLRLQRERHQATHDRNTKDDSTLPSSCAISFELGATHSSIKERPAYVTLKEKVEATIEATQNELKKAIIELQIIEMQAKEEEIRKTFCEGLFKVANALIHYHRDHTPNPNLPKIDEDMQTLRLADRLNELLFEKHPEVFEFSHLQGDFQLYYAQVGRDIPTHSRLQNRNTKSSPYNPLHTQFLEGILDEFYKIVEPCFHSSWKEYLSARTRLHKQQSQQKLTASISINNEDSISNLSSLNTKRRISVSERRNSLSFSDLKNSTTTTTNHTTTGSARRSSTTRISFVDQHQHHHQHQHHPHHHNDKVNMTSADLRGMVKDVVSEETKGLRESIKRVEKCLQKVIKEVVVTEEEEDDDDDSKNEDSKVAGLLNNLHDSKKKKDGCWEGVKRRGSRRNSHNQKEETNQKKNHQHNHSAQNNNNNNNHKENGVHEESKKAAPEKTHDEHDEDETETAEHGEDTPKIKRGKRRSRKKGKGAPNNNTNGASAPLMNGVKKPAEPATTKKDAAEISNGDHSKTGENSKDDSEQGIRTGCADMDDSTAQMFGNLQTGRRRAWG